MPYRLKHSPNGGYDIIAVATGKKVAHSTTKHGAIGYIYHASKGDKPKIHGRKKK